MNVQRWTLTLAIMATSTALSLSVLAGWQRGGTVPERLIWVAIGMVLVASAHLLPALIRNVSRSTRLMGGVLWAACLAATCYGHAEFFTFAQIHAGTQRAAALTIAPSTTSKRSLTAVLEERAAVTAQLAAANARYCMGNCVTLAGRRATLTAQIAALEAEASDARRQRVTDDQAVARRDALLVDPVTARLSALLGTTDAHVDLLASLAFAAVLEGVACVLWTAALRPSLPATLHGTLEVAGTTFVPADAAQASASDETATPTRQTVSGRNEASRPISPDEINPPPSLVVSFNGVVDQLRRDVAVGLLRPTVADIRIHLACSQARALALRRELVKPISTT